MNEILNYLDKALAASDQLFDETAGSIGGFDSSRYTEEYFSRYFQGEKGCLLHNFPASISYALALAVMNQMPERRDFLLQTFLDTAIWPDYELKWFAEEKCIRDANANFFSCVPLLVLTHCYSHLLSQAQKEKSDLLLRKLCDIFLRESKNTSLTYVNPTLGRYAVSALLTEKFMPEKFPPAREKFSGYADFLMDFGMNECNSPAYYVVDLQILSMVLIVSSDDKLKSCARLLLNEIFLKQTAFFGIRFPAPFRRGYNGDYAGHRHDLLMSILGWSPQFYFNNDDPYLCLLLPSLMHLADISCTPDRQTPREQILNIGPECHAVSYLEKNFLLGAFDLYPPITTVWQTVGTGGSGWQDAPVFFSMENQEQTTGILRLEAVDAEGNEKIHPNEGNYSMEKMMRLYPWRSFPPEPSLRTLVRTNHMLCLWKIDRVDAELQRLGFNLHFSRFNGDIYDSQGMKIETGNHQGPVILDCGPVKCAVFPLRRTIMAGATLLTSAGFLNSDCTVRRRQDNLECTMYNYEGPARSFILNHIAGGFFLCLEQNLSLSEFLAKINGIQISEQWESDRINAHIDERDAIRTVIVSIPGEENMSLTWNHFLP